MTNQQIRNQKSQTFYKLGMSVQNRVTRKEFQPPDPRVRLLFCTSLPLLTT